MNPFAELTPPIQNRPVTNLSSRQLASLLDAPPETSAAGVRDRALLQLLSEGLSLPQIYNLDLTYVDLDAHSLTVCMRDGNQELFILLDATWVKLQRWLIIRKLFAMSTDAVFLSLHWTDGRARPGSRLSERGMRAIVTKYLVQIGVKQAGVNSSLITKSAHTQHNKIPHSLGEIP